MDLNPDTRIHDLLKSYPFLEEFLPTLSPRFGLLKSRAARATMGRVATLSMAAGIGGMDAPSLMRAVAAEIRRRTGEAPAVSDEARKETRPDQERLDALKAIILELHDGAEPEGLGRRFSELIADVDVGEIAQMEEQLIREGLLVSEVQRLCDLHVGVFRDSLDGGGEAEAPPGHPVHTYMSENEVITALAEELASLSAGGRSEGGGADLDRADVVLARLSGIDTHYARKENQLFPYLERHGITGPSRVMWGVHGEIRGMLKAARGAVEKGDAAAFLVEAPRLARAVGEMVYKENRILLPLALQTLSDEEWREIRRGEGAIGHPFAAPGNGWPEAIQEQTAPEPLSVGGEERLGLDTGHPTLEQVNLMLTHLPVDLSLVDENDTVVYYSEGRERIFPRSPGVIGRKVQNCHPEKSLHMVDAILEAFRKGTEEVAEFWITMNGRFLHIRYFALRDAAGTYRGCLEVTQDVTNIRALSGERRPLQREKRS